MKQLITLFTLLGLTSITFAQQDYSKVLPGVVKVSESLYYDKTEITNFQWQEYLSWIELNGEGKESPEYLAAMPDQNVWTHDLSYNEPYVQYYFNHEAYRDYPVVGISWEQANDYCTWRTARVMESIRVNEQQKKAPLNFVYRLPTQEEFMLMYQDIASLPDQIGTEGPRKYRGMWRYNMKREGKATHAEAGQLNDNADVTAPVKSYWPNQFGVYNIRGNVAEWLAAENTYAGGSWKDLFDKDVTTPEKSMAPKASIGFRCVCGVSNEAP